MALRAGLHGTVGQSSAQVIDGSLRFDGSKSQYLKRTPSSAGNRRTWTWSAWLKRDKFADDNSYHILFSTRESNSNRHYLSYNADVADELFAYDHTNNNNKIAQTNAKYRDTDWYHVVVVYDTTNSDGGERLKFFINGVENDDWGSYQTNGENFQGLINSVTEHRLGGEPNAPGYFYGRMSQVYFIDGLALGPEYFGFTDSLTNTWRPKKYTGSFAGPLFGYSGTIPTSTTDVPPAGSYGNGIATAAVLFGGTILTNGQNHIRQDGGGIEWSAAIPLTSGDVAGAQCLYFNNTSTHAIEFKIDGNWVTVQSNAQNVIGSTQGQGALITYTASGNVSWTGVKAAGGSNISVTTVAGIFVNDELVGPQTTPPNGFYLPMDGNSPIGQDKSGNGNDWTPVRFGNTNKIDSPDLTGGTPILNTNEAGTVALPGYKTDSNASNLVVALPLVGAEGGTSFNDIAYQIKGSGSSKSFTAFTGNSDGGGKTSTRGSVLYGSSFYTTRGATNSNAGDYIERTGDSDLSMGTGDYCIEFWYHPYDYTTNDVLIDTRHPTTDWPNDDNGIMIYINANGDTAMVSNGVQISGSGVVGKNQDNHFALTREGTTERLFVNGNLIGTATGRNNDYNRDRLHLGSSAPNGEGSSGYYNDLRVYKGVAKYTSPFKVGSPNPTVLPDTPSGVSGGSKITKITDGAVSFDGTNDNLDAGSSSDFEFSSNHTIEAWIYPTATSSDNVVAYYYYTDGAAERGWYFGIQTSSQKLRLGNAGSTSVLSSSKVALNAWSHVAAVTTSGTTQLYINGKADGSPTNIGTPTYSDARLTVGSLVYANQATGYGNYFKGFISNLRVVKGTAVYSGNFTPSTAPLTNVTNTKLLCCQSNTSTTAVAVAPNLSAINDGTHWSGATLSNGSNLAGLFDESLSTNAQQSTNGTAASVTNFGPVNVSSTVSFYSADGDARYTLNGGSEVSVSGTGWHDISFSGTLTSFTFQAPGNARIFIYGMKIDGTQLVDIITPYGGAAATNFNPFNTDINTVRGQETGYATMNPLGTSPNITLSNGNLSASKRSSAGHAWSMSNLSMSPNTGKYYIECTLTELRSGGANITAIGLCHSGGPVDGWVGTAPSAVNHFNIIYNNGTTRQIFDANVVTTNYLTPAGAFTVGDVFQIAYDSDNKVGWFGINGFWYKADGTLGAVPSTGSNPTWVNFLYDEYFFTTDGHDSAYECNFGQKPFKFPPPDGFQPLNDTNLIPETVIARPDQYVDITTWTGNGNTQTISGLEFSPDVTLIKARTGNAYPVFFDTVRGTNKRLAISPSNAGEADEGANGVSAFGVNSFTVTDNSAGDYNVNGPAGGTYSGSSGQYVGWVWKAGGNKGTFNIDDVDVGSAANAKMSVGSLTSVAYDQSQTWSSNTFFNNNGYGYNGSNTITKLFDGVDEGSVGDNYVLPASNGNFTLTFTQFPNAKTVTVRIEGGGNALKINGEFVSLPGGSATERTYNINGLQTIQWFHGTGSTYCWLGSIKVDGIELADNGVTPTNVPTIPSTGCSVGTKQGFSIVKYTGNNTKYASVAHGLNSPIDFMIVKRTNGTGGWAVGSNALDTWGKVLYLSDTGDVYSQVEPFNDTKPTQHVFELFDSSSTNANGGNYVAYCWHNVPGLQKFGSFIGNGNTSDDGPFIELGFRPAIIWFKRTEDDGYNWNCYDTRRSNTGNPTNEVIRLNLSNAEETNYGNGDIDVLSNGFKIRNYWGNVNAANKSYIYAAWAEAPAVNVYGGQSNAR